MEGLTEADGARAQALGVLAALISTVLDSLTFETPAERFNACVASTG
jgi:hypothetical protein